MEEQRRRDQKNESQNRIRAEKRKLSELLPKCDSEQRAACDASLATFLVTCFPNAFALDFSEDHRRLISDIERATTHGLLKALAMPRGSGKTTIVIRAALWAVLTKRRQFVSIVAATETKARQLLKSIKTEILHNEKLHEFYGAELQAVLALGNESRSAAQQNYNGELTGVEWTVEAINFGLVKGSELIGACMSVAGITGNIRGQQQTLPTGEIIRPDMVLIDDPQTKSSAKSNSQCDERHETMMGDVLGMAGPTVDITGVCACTVIYKDDLADRLLDRKASPDWNGDKCQMVYKWPTDQNAWEQYRSISTEEKRTGGDGSKANAFVLDHFDQLHAGAVVAWEQRKGQRAVSALQYAYELRFRDEATFFAEYQNTPLTGVSELPFDLNADEIAARINGNGREQVPAECDKITAQIDVQKNVLFYVVTAWTLGGRGHVISYGTWPDQKRLRFTKGDLTRKLAEVTNASTLAEAVYTGLERLTEQLLRRAWNRDDGVTLSIDRLGIDAKWGQSTGTVRRFVRESGYGSRVLPTMGQYVGAKSMPWQNRNNDRGTWLGNHVRLQAAKADRRVRELLIDTNHWKSTTAELLSVGKGAARALLLFRGPPHVHKLLADHCCEETAEQTETKAGRQLIEWRQPPHAENDLWDCLVCTAALASVEGVAFGATSQADSKPARDPKRRKRKVTPLAC